MPAEAAKISVEGGADQEEEALFSSASNTPSRCLPAYSVQSPSGSYYPCNGAVIESCNVRGAAAAGGRYRVQNMARAAAPTVIALSTYSSISSSRGSSNNTALSSFLAENKKAAAPAAQHVLYDVQSRGDDGDSTASRLTSLSGDRHERQRLVIVDRKGPARDDGEDDSNRSRDGIWRYVPVDPSAPCCCIAFHLAWRLLASLGAALLVFYMVTKPPPPTASVKVLRIHTFALREGVDDTGVVTNLLTCNCSIGIEIENHSKVFDLFIRPALMMMSYGRLTIVTKQGYGAHVKAGSNSVLSMYIGTTDKPMYGAGRAMQDSLKLAGGLQINILFHSRLSYSVVGNLVKPRFSESTYCNPILNRSHHKRGSLNYESTCSSSVHYA